MQKVLIVDDHPDIRRLMSITLGREYETLEAEDGASALAMVRKLHPIAVLLDVMMPGTMDGLQVLEAIKADPSTRHIRVAMVTARGQMADSEDARRRGADAYFVKPFSPARVARWIREHAQ